MAAKVDAEDGHAGVDELRVVLDFFEELVHTP